jgi:peptidoglycan/LPS O-acetylase OafA/YrhL
MDALLLGTLCAWLVRQPNAAPRIRNAMPALRVTLLSCGGFVLLTAYTGETALTWIGRYTLLALAFASWLLIALYDEKSLLSRSMRLPMLRAVGVIAFGTYLVHNAVNGIFWSALRRHPPYFDRLSDVFLTVIPLLGSLAIAAASWRYFEKPIVRFGQRAQFT